MEKKLFHVLCVQVQFQPGPVLPSLLEDVVDHMVGIRVEQVPSAANDIKMKWLTPREDWMKLPFMTQTPYCMGLTDMDL